MSWTGSTVPPGPGTDAADLLAEIAPTSRGTPGAWSLELSRRWDFLLPSGGVLVSAALRAAVAELATPELRLVSASTVFCTPIQPGALDADVTVLRRGGSAAQVRIALRNTAPGVGAAPERGPDAQSYGVGPGLETLATFAKDREGPEILGAHFPDVPMPDDCGDLVDDAPGNAHGRVPFFRNFEARLALGARFWLPGWQAGPARYARWFRYRVPPRGPDGSLDRLAHPPIIDTMPPALASALGPSSYRFYAPSLDLTLHVLDDTDREWLLATVYARRARAGYATAEVEVWDDTRRLVAYGTQTMYLRTIAGKPPTGVVAPP